MNTKTAMKWIILAILAIAFAMACSDKSKNAEGDDLDTESENSIATDADADTDSDTDSDADADDSSGELVACETLSTDLSKVATRVMLLLDKSRSMDDNDKWTTAVDAVTSMVNAYNTDISFGFDLFSISSDSNQNNSSNCVVGESVVQDVALENASAITTELENWGPSAATPLLLGMQNYTDAAYAPIFLDGSGGSYLVVISDGQDTCGANGVFNSDEGASAEELSVVTTTLLEEYGIHTFVIGFGDGVDPDQLNAIAAAGGTTFTEYLVAGNADELNDALSTIGETVVVSCEFQVGTFENEDVNYNRVVVTFDDTQIPRDDNCAGNQGWTWIGDDHAAIRFCDDACTTLESGAIQEVKVELACTDDDVQIITVE